jgi:hypothetical protein
MILRSLTHHVNSQNWFAVWLDLFIVVLGVFIGIQVANWNEARVDQKRAQGYLERIGEDLNADIIAITDRSRFWRQVADYGAVGLEYANTGEAGNHSQWELLLAYFQASQVAELYLTQSTFDELKSAGELRLISDLDLRAELAQYYLFPASATMNTRPAYREHVRGVIPLDIQKYIWDSCYTSDGADEQKMLPCPSPVDEETVSNLVSAISTNVMMMSELRFWMSSLHVAGIIGRGMLHFASQLRRDIEMQGVEIPQDSAP